MTLTNKLTHSVWHGSTKKQGRWAETLFAKDHTLCTFETALQKIAYPKNLSDLGINDPNVVAGDLWEGFNEILIKAFGLFPDVGITDAKACPPGNIGVDFTGVGKDGKIATVQSKYKGKGKAWTDELRATEDMRLERFLTQSQNIYMVDINSTENMVIITNASKIHYWTNDQLLFNKVRCIGRPEIEYLVNGNIAFWNFARLLIEETNSLIKF